MTTSSSLPLHPGEVRMPDMFTQELKVLPVQAVPIVEVRMFPIDAEGRLVEKSKAVRIRITEHGPDGQALRSTPMLPK